MAVQTKAQLTTSIATLLADNTAGNISAADTRTITQNIVDSYPDIVSINVDVSTAEILALFVTPKTLIPAPGVGKYIKIWSADGKVTYNSIAYSGGTGILIGYNIANNEVWYFSNLFLAATATTRVTAQKDDSEIVPENTALVLFTVTAPITTGNSNIQINIRYSIENY